MGKSKRQRQAKIGGVENERLRAIERVRRQLVRGGHPRLLILFLLVLTGVAGFLVSSALLHLGITMMAVRYPLAVLAAYTVFLLLLRLWLALQGKTGSNLDWLSDIGDAVPNVFSSDAVASEVAKFGGGGDFGGAGAGGDWVGSAASSVSGGDCAQAAGGGSFLPDVDLDVDLDLGEGCFWIVIPVVAITGAVVAMFYVIYIAPVFLAEILVDALLVAGLYKRLKKVEPRHWLHSCVRRTLVPVLLTTALFIA
ncbi:MAG: hypothetical protein LC747_08715, partial [Acidobacteria bacterium]|nr:hypothetical protein [Acidobacteriota bacterium]